MDMCKEDEGIAPVEFDGQIAMKDTVDNLEPVHLEIIVPMTVDDIGGQNRIAVPVKYLPRKKMLRVRINMGRYLSKKKLKNKRDKWGDEIEICKMKDKHRIIDIPLQCIRYAYVGEMGDYWKMEVVD